MPEILERHLADHRDRRGMAGIAVWKPKGWLSKTSGVLSVIILIGLVVAIWAMGAKPT